MVVIQESTEPLLAVYLSDPLIVTKPDASIANLLSQDSVFFHQEFDDVPLILVHPAGHRRDEE
jgi:hypothetical protein